MNLREIYTRLSALVIPLACIRAMKRQSLGLLQNTFANMRNAKRADGHCFCESSGLAFGVLAMTFVYIRLGIVAIALNVVLGEIHHLPTLQIASVALYIGYLAMLLVKTLRSAISVGGVVLIDRLHGLSMRTSGLFWLSVGYFMAWALAAMVLGAPVALVVAVIWAVSMIGLLSYLLAREMSASVPPVALLETLLGLRPGKFAAAFRKQRVNR